MRREELEWFYQNGASMLFPDLFVPYQALIPEEERGDMMKAYYKRLTGDDEEEKQKWSGLSFMIGYYSADLAPVLARGVPGKEPRRSW